MEALLNMLKNDLEERMNPEGKMSLKQEYMGCE